MTPSPSRAWRPVHGIVRLDKPQGLSSNQALQRVRRIFGAEKGGHTGARDPLATGLLPICLGEATKIAGLLLEGDKCYLARVALGVETDTDDAEGRMLQQRPVPALDHERVAAALTPCIGRIRQAPPRYSARKQGGEPRYRKARRGEEFALRDMGEDWLDLEVTCGSGTYIRSLARDLGRALGCGGHIAALRRRWVEPFRAPRMFTLEDLAERAQSGPAGLDAVLLPIEAGLAHWPRIVLDPDQAQRLRQGQRFAVSAADGPQLALDADGKALGLVDVVRGVLQARRLFQRPAA